MSALSVTARLARCERDDDCHQVLFRLPAKCVVEFYFDWLNELIDRRDNEGESICGHVVAGLYR
jgi:hypothetical protein